MDLERPVRDCLLKYLVPHFEVLEEAYLIGSSGKLRCDVLARPKAMEFQGYLFAFECKRPDKEWHYARWARAIKQAIDNVGATTTKNSAKLFGADLSVTASFVFPAPFEVPSQIPFESSSLVRDGFENAVAGMFHLALMFRCGRARVHTHGEVKSLGLALGPTQIWSNSSGFYSRAHDLLADGRPYGASNRK